MTEKDSLKQYLDLFDEYREIFSSYGPNNFSMLRNLAYDKLKESTFPCYSTEGYEKTSINKMFAPDLGINLNRLNVADGINYTGCMSEMSNAVRIKVLNDRVVSIELPGKIEELPPQVSIRNFNDLNDSEAELYKSMLERLFDKPHNETSLLNVLLGTDGLIIDVADDYDFSYPIQVIYYTGASQPLLSNRKLLVRIGKNSSLKLLLCDHSLSDLPFINVVNDLIIIEQQNFSNLEFVGIEESNLKTSRISDFYLSPSERCEATIHNLTLMNGNTRNNFYIENNLPLSKVNIKGLAIGSQTSHIDNYTNIIHNADCGKSNQLFKYVLDNNSTGAFGGEIIVSENCRFNEAHQSNKNILVSAEARMYSKPQLLIYNDDVKCSHGCSTGQLDENAIFYMQTRGVPRAEAVSMLIQAFMSDIIDGIGVAGLNERLRWLVERRLKGDNLLCMNCNKRNDA